MNQSVEFHDSVLGHAEKSGDLIALHFSRAYIHRSAGEPGVNAGDGLVQPLLLSFSGASYVGNLEAASGWVSDGYVSVSGNRYSLVPLPFNQTGEVRAEFVFTSGLTLSISASSVCSKLLGEPRWVERFAS